MCMQTEQHTGATDQLLQRLMQGPQDSPPLAPTWTAELISLHASMVCEPYHAKDPYGAA